MGFVSVLTMAQQLAARALRPGDAAVDATAGNGVDTRFLAETVGTKGVVYAFDIKAEAIARARARLEGAAGAKPLGAVQFILADHAEMKRHIPSALHGRIGAVMFNLGYLPGGSRPDVVTKPDSTLRALASALEMLRRDGVLTAVVYAGHPGGAEEAEAVEGWASGLPPEQYQTLCYRFVNQPRHSPYLLAVCKKSGDAAP